MSVVATAPDRAGLLGGAGDDAVRDLPSWMAGAAPAAASAVPADRIRVGVDVTDVDQVADSVRIFGARYLERIYTPHELECCASATTDSGLSCESLAARFAAKEAAIKVLRPSGPRPEWRSIEVRRHHDGGCGLRLTGLAATLAEGAALGHLAVSLSHDAGIAAAVVVALSTDPGGALAPAPARDPAADNPPTGSTSDPSTPARSVDHRTGHDDTQEEKE